MARYLDSGGAHYEATRQTARAEGSGRRGRQERRAEAHAEREAASAVVGLLHTHVVRPHVLEAKAALCLWSNTLNALVAALSDYELSGRLPPTTASTPPPTWCATSTPCVGGVRGPTSRAGLLRPGREPRWRADAGGRDAPACRQPGDAAASAAMVVVARWTTTKRAGQRTAALAGRRAVARRASAPRRRSRRKTSTTCACSRAGWRCTRRRCTGRARRRSTGRKA